MHYHYTSILHSRLNYNVEMLLNQQSLKGLHDAASIGQTGWH